MVRPKSDIQKIRVSVRAHKEIWSGISSCAENEGMRPGTFATILVDDYLSNISVDDYKENTFSFLYVLNRGQRSSFITSKISVYLLPDKYEKLMRICETFDTRPQDVFNNIWTGYLTSADD